MKTNEERKSEDGITRIQLIKGNFIPAEASEIIMNLINEKINFHKVQRLQMWETNHNFKTDVIDERIKELESEKIKAKALFDKAKDQKLQLKINSSIEINILKTITSQL